MTENVKAAETAQTTEQAQIKELVEMSIKEFCQKNGYKQIGGTVKVNTSGYPFITFINPDKPKDQQAENVYFSKKSAAGVDVGTVVDKKLLAQYRIGITQNAAGEERIKLITLSRQDVADLFD